MAARIVAVSLALLLAGFGAISLRDHDSCQEQSARMIDVIVGKVQRADRYVDEFLDECRGSRILALTANGLARRGKLDDAVRISDEAIRREPRNYEGWAALAAALRKRGLDAAADRATGRAQALNPRFGRGPG
ncbi:MAG: hypothetical protein ACJ762_19295 [Solirubrobacteraceae bacterium]